MQLTSRLTKGAAASALILTSLAPLPIVPTAPALAYTQSGCVNLQVSGTSFVVVNSCPHSVIGSFCFMSGDYLNCQNHDFGGFGPIRPGGTEGTAKSAREYTEWRVSYCNYDDWNAGECHAPDPYR